MEQGKLKRKLISHIAAIIVMMVSLFVAYILYIIFNNNLVVKYVTSFVALALIIALIVVYIFTRKLLQKTYELENNKTSQIKNKNKVFKKNQIFKSKVYKIKKSRN